MAILSALVFITSAAAYPIFPKTHASLNDRALIHEVRARVNPPTPDDYKSMGIDWPHTPEHSRALEVAIERELTTRLLRPNGEFDVTLRLPYFALHARVEQRDIARRPEVRPAYNLTKITAYASLIHLRTGRLSAEVPLQFEWTSALGSRGRAKMTLTEIAGQRLTGVLTGDAERLADALEEPIRTCAALL